MEQIQNSQVQNFFEQLNFVVQSVGGDPNPDNTISIQYGTGDATGYEAQETMSLGSPPITIRNQTFMTIVQLSVSFYNSPCDGLMVRPPTSLLAAKFHPGGHLSRAMQE